MNTDPPSPAAPAPHRSAAVVFIFVTVLLDMVALGIIIPVLPKLVLGFLHGNTAQGAKVFGLFGMVWAAMQFFCSPLIGTLSDRFGRRPVILLSNLGLGLDYILMALAPSLGWLFVGRVISGITAATYPTASAYIADVAPPEKRAASFGLLGAAFGIGFVLGPAIGGLLGKVDPHLPFWFAAGLSLLNTVYGLFVLPESLPPEKRTAFAWRRANPVGSLRLLRSHPELMGLAVVNVLGLLAHEVLPSVYVLYAGYRFGWDERAVGLSLASVGVCSGLVQSVLIRPIVARLGERRTLFVSLWFGAASFAIMAFAPTGFWFWTSVPVMAFWGLGGPTVSGLMSRRVGASEQGQLHGANNSLQGMSGMMGPPLFTLIFATFISGGWATHRGWNLPGAPFVLAGTLVLVSMGVAWIVVRKVGDSVGDLDADGPMATAPSTGLSDLSPIDG